MAVGKLSEHVDEGDLMSVATFKAICVAGGFVDGDGYGCPVRGDEIDMDNIVAPSRIALIPDGVTHVLWFER